MGQVGLVDWVSVGEEGRHAHAHEHARTHKRARARTNTRACINHESQKWWQRQRNGDDDNDNNDGNDERCTSCRQLDAISLQVWLLCIFSSALLSLDIFFSALLSALSLSLSLQPLISVQTYGNVHTHTHLLERMPMHMPTHLLLPFGAITNMP